MKKNVWSMIGTWMCGCAVFTACSDVEEEGATPDLKYSPYVTKVLDYCPAPGQFTNNLPIYVKGDTQETMNQKVLTAIGHNKKGMISLGGFGGYVVVGFDHTIENVVGDRDFRVLGNAFYAFSNPNQDTDKQGGSCEPGIVMVAHDKNKNGKPDDDEWYELAGSEYAKPTTVKAYEITYYRPNENKVPVPGNANIIDKEYIRWTDKTGGTGFVEKNAFNAGHSYYPEWISKENLTFKGTLLADNGVNEGTTEDEYWVLYKQDWGYADNVPNNQEEATFDIGWAVDKNGKKVKLPGADFVKIYTAVNQSCGQIGEVSTEFCGIEDLHLLKK